MVVTGNMLIRGKAYADQHYPGDNQENRIAQQSYLDGFRAGYEKTSWEWLRYCRNIEQYAKRGRWSAYFAALFLGMMMGLWRCLCCYMGWHKYEEVLDKAEQRQFWSVLPPDFLSAKSTYFRCKRCGKREIVLTVGFSSKMRRI